MSRGSAVIRMLEPLRHVLESQRNILASQSPRRREILTKMNFPFEVIVSDFVEDLDVRDYPSAGEYAVATARGKAKAVRERLERDCSHYDLIIACDTVVVQGTEYFGKPLDKSDASRMLNKLSGKQHSVFSGVSLLLNSAEHKVVERCFSEATTVYMTHLSPSLITSYIDTGEPMDKAGGYGIQALGGSFIEKIEGCYYNVMGFPLHAFCKQLVQLYDEMRADGRGDKMG